MDNGNRLLFIIFIYMVFANTNNGCDIEGITTWWKDFSVIDTQRGVIFHGTTTNILGIVSAVHSGDSLNAGPYFTAHHEDSQFVLALNDNYAIYEENETAQSMSISVSFSCSDGGTKNIVFIISIVDTNNNAPVFTQSNEIVFRVTPPLPPGYQLTGCLNDIAVRDIDLTTKKLEFTIQENDLVDIEYNAESTSEPKNFKAKLRTTSFIRSLPEPIVLTISATDVDETGDPPLTTYATIRIESDGRFELPEEPKFSQTFYMATYSSSNVLTIEDAIYLDQGYHSEIKFGIVGDYSDYFHLSEAYNSISIQSTSELPLDILKSEKQLYLIVKAERNNTSGASSTVIIQLPEDEPLAFEQTLYKGTIKDNVMNLSSLRLTGGYTLGYEVAIQSDYDSYFSIVSNDNELILSMAPLDEDIIEYNNFLSLEVITTSFTSKATAVVILEIIKGKITSLAFEQNIYKGNYVTNEGLILNDLVLTRGYDDTVSFYVEGDYSDLFLLSHSSNILSLHLLDTIPDNIIEAENVIHLTILATKPGVDDVHTVVSIELPRDRRLKFEQSNYVVQLRDSNFAIENIRLYNYATDVSFQLIGELATYFDVIDNDGHVTLQSVTALPEEIILDNDLIVLTLEASALYSETTATTIVIEIIKQDSNTPVFNSSSYEGDFEVSEAFRISGISLSQGHDDTVAVQLEGDDSKYFTITDDGTNNYEIILENDIPKEVIMEKKVLTFNIEAKKPLTVGAVATVIVRFPSDLTEPIVMSFTKTTYLGHISQETLTTEDIVLLTEYDSEMQFEITGEYSEYFSLYTVENYLNILLNRTLPLNIDSNIIVLTLEASQPRSVAAKAGLIIQIDDNTPLVPVFNEAYYKGYYSVETGFIFDYPIYLQEGYSDDVFFFLDGENSQWFSLEQAGNSLTLEVANEIPKEILIGHRNLLFTIVAHKSDEAESRAAIFVELITDSSTSNGTSIFTNAYYYGTIGNTGLNIDPIEVHEDFDFAAEVAFTLTGEYTEYFNVTRDESHIYIIFDSDLPVSEIADKNVLIFSLKASTQTESAQATIVIEIIRQASAMTFEQEYYTGNYSNKDGLHFEYEIKLDSYEAGNDVQLSLSGEHSQWFALEETENGVTLAILNEIPAEILENSYSLIFYVTASDGSNKETTRATIIIALIHNADTSISTATINFERNSYQGFIKDDVVSLNTNISLEEAIDNISFSLTGDYSKHFLIINEGVKVILTVSEPLPQDALSNILVLEIEASAADTTPGYTTVILEVKGEDAKQLELSFSEGLYIGHYSENNVLEFDQTISLSVGYEDGVIFVLDGEHASWFSLIQNDNQATLTLSAPISTDVLENNNLIVLTIATITHENVAEAFIIITLERELRDPLVTNPVSAFDKALYSGIVNVTMVQHEMISVEGGSGKVELFGTYADLFLADLSDELVNIILKEPVPFADEIKYIALELQYEGIRAVLLLNVSHTDNTLIPTVDFDADSYHITVDIASAGQIGQVRASATNGEALHYTLRTDNAHLKERIFINDDGGIYLSALVNSGRYILEVQATTIASHIFTVAPVTLTVEAVFSCDKNSVEVPPLITLSGDEEIPHENLLVLNTTRDCWYTIENSWPPGQDWLFVNENGLHSRAIDREDERIAFMALSQIQVELLLHCRDDSHTRHTRSTDVVRPDWLGPYDYESHNWVLTENILFNSRRTFVNFIVNDINDNAPILEGKEDNPLVIGYPVPDLLDYIEPSALIRLKASDADIGINAEVVYWTDSPQINVSPTTGTVHLPDNERNLADGTQVTVYATDRMGEGLVGELNLLIRLLNDSHITVITIRNAYLEYEEDILNNIASSVGYDVKSIKSVVLSDEYDVGGDPENLARGSSLKLFVYGLINNEPTLASQLIFDLNNSNTRQATQVAIAESVTLRDYLDKRQLEVILIAEGRRDIGLLITTIVLSILLFIIIVVIAVWLFLQWRTTRNYDKFSDPGSLDSDDSSLDKSPRTSDSLVISPQDMKIAENRFQVTPVRDFGQTEKNAYVVIDMPESNETNSTASNPEAFEMRDSDVIQTIDKLKDPDDGGGNESKGKKSKRQRTKSVTFNEKVEAIILPEPEEMGGSIPEIYSIRL